VLGTVVGLIIIGVVAGFVARSLVPGAQLISLWHKIVLGIAGSFVGGLLGRLVFHHGRGFLQVTSWIGAILGSVIVLLVYMARPAATRLGPGRDRAGHMIGA
jgi:uncharacterized membrane protein YeaQ/YmgE (transglycosylase-associated protein family)